MLLGSVVLGESSLSEGHVFTLYKGLGFLKILPMKNTSIDPPSPMFQLFGVYCNVDILHTDTYVASESKAFAL